MIYKFKDNKPEVDETAFIAPGARIVGSVTLKENTSIWYNSVLRADLNQMVLGKGTNIQENSALHVDTDKPLNIGDYVTVGHSATVHGCTVKNNCLIGMGAVLLNNAVINENTIVAAGSLVTENKEFPAGSLIMGSPAKVVRELTEEEIASIQKSAEHYMQLAKEHKESI